MSVEARSARERTLESSQSSDPLNVDHPVIGRSRQTTRRVGREYDLRGFSELLTERQALTSSYPHLSTDRNIRWIHHLCELRRNFA
jgi:hypothetical protein